MELSKFDQLIYIAQEAEYSEETIVKKVKELFPDFIDDGDDYNDRFLTDYNLEQYAYNRSLGLPIVEVANSIRLSATLLYTMHQGHRLSLKKLVDLAHAEIFAAAETKASHLGELEKEAGRKATVTFLEKAYSKTYGDKKQIDINTGFATAEDKTWAIEVTHVDNMSKVSEDQKHIDKVIEDAPEA